MSKNNPSEGMYYCLQNYALSMNEYKQYSDVIPIDDHIEMVENFIKLLDIYRDSEKHRDELNEKMEKLLGIKYK